jgi:SAM-dependent methyltransferase
VRFADKALRALSYPEQYARQAEDWTDQAYADARAYLEHRARLVIELGPRLEPGAEVLDLACGDAGLGELLLERGLRYRGVDSTPEMVEAARARLGERAPVELGDLNEYVPPAAVAATTVFRALYYAHDHAAFFRHVAGFTEKKLVFDLNPRQYRVEDVLDDLRPAGFAETALRPFFIPQTKALPRPLAAAARALEHSGPLARAALRYRFTYLVAASRRPD